MQPGQHLLPGLDLLCPEIHRHGRTQPQPPAELTNAPPATVIAVLGPVRSCDHVPGKRLEGMMIELIAFQSPVTPPKEVRPMNALPTWVLPPSVTAGD
jgi:hypothetical protein